MLGGVYKIINLIPNKKTGIHKVYIGSTVNFYKREMEHFNDLKSNRHRNRYLQNAYNKIKREYGEENVVHYFKFEPIIEIEKSELLVKIEQLCINEFIFNGKIQRNKCYNLSPNATSQLGIIRSKEFKNKVRLSRTGFKHSEESKIKISIATTGEHNPNYNRKHTDKTKNKISKINKGNAYRLGKKHSEESKNKISESHNIKVINLTTGEIFDSIKDAAKKYSIKSPCNISAVCKGKGKTIKGCRWSYLDIEEVVI